MCYFLPSCVVAYGASLLLMEEERERETFLLLPPCRPPCRHVLSVLVL
jgi:hypothetical protein